MNSKANGTEAEGLLRAWREGRVCLHPTDTIPGLSFNPNQPEAVHELTQLKGRDSEKTCISLVSHLELAMSYWHQLPPGWEDLLNFFWPGPLTVIWKAKKDYTQVRSDGTVAFRAPKFSKACDWMHTVLTELKAPFPSTSVNKSGESPCVSWEDALSFAAQSNAVYTPPWQHTGRFSEAPSTVIKLEESGDFIPIREGCIKVADIRKEWHHVTSNRT